MFPRRAFFGLNYDNRARAIFLVFVAICLSSVAGRISAASAEDGAADIAASAGLDRHASVGQAIQLDASGSTSASGRALRYRSGDHPAAVG